MCWQELRLRMDDTGTGERVWKLLWAASVAGEQVDEGDAIFVLDGKQGTRTLYFPPSASMLAASVGARPCGKPEREDLELLAGRLGAWDVHFGDARAAARPAVESARAA